MMWKKKHKEKGVLSTRQLMGIERIEENCVCTPYGDLVFFIVQPTNISVLPRTGIDARIRSLLNVLRSQPELELLAKDRNHLDERSQLDLAQGIYGYVAV